MITANLTVLDRPNDEGSEESRQEEWGAIGLSCAPGASDLIKMWHHSDFHFVRVERVVHHSVVWPLPDEDSLHRREPFIEIVAKWVTIDLSGY